MRSTTYIKLTNRATFVRTFLRKKTQNTNLLPDVKYNSTSIIQNSFRDMSRAWLEVNNVTLKFGTWRYDIEVLHVFDCAFFVRELYALNKIDAIYSMWEH